MSLGIPMDRRLARSAELEAFVRAIVAAHVDEPETDAIEWKGTLDLSRRDVRYQLARHLLGFGNRTVAQAQRAFEGHAYLVTGAEPGDLRGCEIPDPADLRNAISRFVAHGRPSWQLHRVDIGGVGVAVVEIAPPSEGQRICTLQRAYDSAAAGRVFVRRHGQTAEADPDEIEALEDRFAARALRNAEQAAALQERGASIAERQLALEEARSARELQEQAERDAPNFVPSRLSAGFEYIAPDEVRGMVRNTGRVAATISHVRLHHRAAAIPGAAVVAYGPVPKGEFGMPARIESRLYTSIRFVHASFAGLELQSEPLILELTFANDSGFEWRQLLTMRRSGSVHDHPLWTIREGEGERELVGSPDRGTAPSSI